MYLIILIVFLVNLISSKSNYNPELAKQLVYYSGACFCSIEKIESWSGEACSHNPGFKDITVITNEEHQSQMYIGYNALQNFIVIAFRGSDNKRNWEDDFDYKKMEYPYCQGCAVHGGFYKAYNSIKEQIFQVYSVLKKKYPQSELVITGHSLGAAQAQLCALDFYQQGIKADFIYPFGSPRVGNKAFSEYGGSVLPHINNVIHYKDPVPHLPIRSMGFIRIPTEIWYYDVEKVSEFKICPTIPGKEDVSCSDQYFDIDAMDQHSYYLGIYVDCDTKNEQQIDNKQTNKKLQQILKSQISRSQSTQKYLRSIQE